jgi:outer membrane PBP1 activator LpoA protein
MKHYFKIITLAGVALILASCATQPDYSPKGVSNAEELYLAHEYADAAKAFKQQADGATGSERNILLLRTVIAYIKAEQLPQAVKIFHSFLINKTDARESSLERLTRAHLALAERNAEEVLKQLSEPMPGDSPKTYLAEYHELRGAAFSMQGDRLATAKEYIQQAHYLTDKKSILQSQHLIWESLAMLSERSLQQLQPARAPDVLSGWMELVRLSKKYQLNPILLRASINNWQRQYSQHPVDISLLDGLRNRKQDDVKLPERIALLLPLTGAFAYPAKAIRDGLLASYYAQKNKLREDKSEVTIRIYDTAGKPEIIEDVYQQAVSEGAQFVIGPLNKESIEVLVNRGSLSVPTLALNYINPESSLSTDLYQIGLSPEEEARQVAERTWLDGHVNAAVLTPAGPWGDRVFNAFRERWEEVGGHIVGQQSYNSNTNDYKSPIQKLFNLDESQIRYREMSRILRTTLKYTPRRRQDIDFIFVAGHPPQARHIRPLLKFYYASSIPVYSTRHVFSGNLDPERDRDMDGMRFGDMPWVLSETTPHRGLRNDIEAQISKEGNKHPRLYALGVDSFNIIAALNTLKTYPYERYQGETGSLSLDSKQRIKRQLSWVYFRSGRPILLDETSQ